jgi:hypothetical protein
MSHLHRVARLGRRDEVVECLAAGANVNEFSIHHFTPLMLAAREGHADVVRLLLAAGANANAAHPNGRTTLHLAAANGHLEVVQQLVEHGARLDAVSRGDRTALLEAAVFNHAPVVTYLIEQGANADVRDPEGLTAEEWQAQGGWSSRLQREHPEWFDPSAEPPLATEAAEREVRRQMADGLAADEYAAKHGRCILIWSYGSYRYRDATVQTWARRVSEVLRSPELLEACEERFLHGEELDDARQLRARRARRQARPTGRS